jgi:hypothetical protein
MHTIIVAGATVKVLLFAVPPLVEIGFPASPNSYSLKSSPGKATVVILAKTLLCAIAGFKLGTLFKFIGG